MRGPTQLWFTVYLRAQQCVPVYRVPSIPTASLQSGWHYTCPIGDGTQSWKGQANPQQSCSYQGVGTGLCTGVCDLMAGKANALSTTEGENTVSCRQCH